MYLNCDKQDFMQKWKYHNMPLSEIMPQFDQSVLYFYFSHAAAFFSEVKACLSMAHLVDIEGQSILKLDAEASRQRVESLS